MKNIYICSRPCLDLLSQNIFRSSCPPSFRDIFLHRLIKEEQHQLNFRLYVKNVMYSKKLSVLSEEYFISANNLNSCFTLMLLVKMFFVTIFLQDIKSRISKQPPELLMTINLVPCVSVGTLKFALLLTFQFNGVCRSFFITSKSSLRTSSKHNLFDLSYFRSFFAKPQFVFSRHNKISPLLLSRLTLNSESTPCLFVAVML